METSVTDTEPFERMLDAVGHKYRRRLLVALADHNPQDEEDAHDAEESLGAIVNDRTDRDIVETTMYHNHLPKLEEYGYIVWDDEHGEIKKGPKWDEIAPLLSLLREHQDELPEDWL